jgi:CO dehydrogenase maturation factor
VKIAVAGKGGSGKTTLAGTLARALTELDASVIAVDCDANPMLGISLGLGPHKTELLVAARQGLDDGTVEHQTTADGILATFGVDAPGGVRLVVVSRIDRADPG